MKLLRFLKKYFENLFISFIKKIARKKDYIGMYVARLHDDISIEDISNEHLPNKDISKIDISNEDLSNEDISNEDKPKIYWLG
jgi:hypothetical protein